MAAYVVAIRFFLIAMARVHVWLWNTRPRAYQLLKRYLSRFPLTTANCELTTSSSAMVWRIIVANWIIQTTASDSSRKYPTMMLSNPPASYYLFPPASLERISDWSTLSFCLELKELRLQSASHTPTLKTINNLPKNRRFKGLHRKPSRRFY